MPGLSPFMAGVVLPLTLALPAIQQGAPTAAEIEIIQALQDRHARLTVPVTIGSGEQRPFRFLVDTGAERTVLARSVASQLGLVPRQTATLVGIAGTQQVDLAEVDELRLGQKSFYGLSTPLLEDEHIGADGIIGLDSLQGQRVLLDFVHNRLAIGEAKSLGGNRGFEIVVTARRKSGQLILTDAIIEGVHTAIVIDTGAEISIGNLALQRALAKGRADNPALLLSVTGQQIAAPRALARSLKIGSVTLTNTEIAFAEAPPFERLALHKKPAMLLGMTQLRLFKRVAIDFSTRRILFDLPDETAQALATPSSAPTGRLPSNGWQ